MASVRAFFGGGASSELCAAKKAATAAFRSPSGPACLRNASSGGVPGRGGAGDGFFGWGDAFGGGTQAGGAGGGGGAGDFAFGGGGGGDGDDGAGFRWGDDAFGDDFVGFGTSAPDASTDVLRIACNPKRCTAAWYSRAAVSSSL